MLGQERRFKYELRDAETGKYIAEMKGRIYSASGKGHYNVGDEILLPDAILFTNNCWRLRSCIVDRLESLGETDNFIAYLRVTKKEIKPLGFIDWQKARKHFVRGIDWSGSDNWLNLD